MLSLNGTNTGTFEIRTYSGAKYSIDLDRHTLVRHPSDEPTTGHLRRDDSEVVLLSVLECTSGCPALFAIDLGILGVPFTLRSTSTVISIFRTTDSAYELPTVLEKQQRAVNRIIERAANREERPEGCGQP
jgi:hypothetical protein